MPKPHLRETEAAHTRLREKDGLETLHPAVTRTCCITRAYVGDLGIVVRAATLSFWLGCGMLARPSFAVFSMPAHLLSANGRSSS
jgi:hypothetical protein